MSEVKGVNSWDGSVQTYKYVQKHGYEFDQHTQFNDSRYTMYISVSKQGPFTGTYGDYRLFFCEWVKFFVLIEQTLIRSDLNKGYQQMIKANRKILSNE